VDILEGANQATENRMSLHTGGNCTVTGSGETGTLVTKNCFAYAAGQDANAGCAVLPSSSIPSYGTEFNSQQGGVFAMEWTSIAIKIWFFPRGSIPASIRAGRPHPAAFGTPAANFQARCIDSYFAPQKLVSLGPKARNSSCPANKLTVPSSLTRRSAVTTLATFGNQDHGEHSRLLHIER